VRRIEKVTELWQFAVAHPEGFTRDDVASACSWAEQPSHFFAVVRALRITIGAETDINLVCEPQGPNERWRYRLVGTAEAAGPWSRNRLSDTEARLDTIYGVSRSLVAATDGRSTDGRKARLIEKSVRRLREDLGELRQGV
jgi:hypothetical protein